MSEFQFAKYLKRIVIVFALGAWGLSIYFSADGFNFNAPGFFLVGVFLGLLVTVFEVVLNQGVKNLTLRAVGVLAYLWGWGTNAVGIWLAQGSPDIGENYSRLLIPIVLGAILELAPEPLLLWALNIEGHDLLGTLFKPQRKRPQPRYETPPVYQPQNRIRRELDPQSPRRNR